MRDAWRNDRFFQRLAARVGYGMGGGVRDIVYEQPGPSPVDSTHGMGGQPITFPATNDYDVPDTLTLDHNRQMPYHEGSADPEIGEIELAAELGQNLKSLTEEQPQAPLSQHELWSESYADGVHLGQAQRKPWVAVDLDGTILAEAPPAAPSEHGRQLPFGEVLPGAQRALAELVQLGWRVSIYTARFGDEGLSEATVQRWAHEIAEYLRSQEIPFSDIWVGRKPRADFFVDNKAIKFEGDWAAVLEALTLIDAPPRKTQDDTFSQDAGGPFDYVEDPNDFNDPLGSRRSLGVDRPRDLEGLQ